MTLPTIENVLWAAGLLSNVALCSCLLLRRGARSFPFFTGWILFLIIRTVILMVIRQRDLQDLYRYVYSYGQIPELILVVGIAIELTNHVLRPAGKWSWGVKKPFALFALGAILVAVLMVAALRPEAPTTFLGWLYPSNLFCSALIFELGLAVMLAAHQFGLAWRNHVMGLAQGWIGWSGVMFAVEAARSYFPHASIIPWLVEIRMYAYLAAALLWTVTFWRPEPARAPLTSGMKAVFSSTFAELSIDDKK